MPGYFQTATYDGQYFTDALREDLIIRVSENKNILVGVGSNVQSMLMITPEEILMKGTFRLGALHVDKAYLLLERPDQPLITSVGTLNNLNIHNHLIVDKNLFTVDNINKQVRINSTNVYPQEYQLCVDSNIFTHNIDVQDLIRTSNLDITGNLRILGEVHTIDTNMQITEQFSISNDGTGPALIVRQLGNTDIAHFYDDNTTAFIIKDGGNIGINTDNPTEKLTVEGNTYISSNLSVTGDTLISSNLHILESSFIQGQLSIQSKLTVIDTIETHNDLKCHNNLTVFNNTSLQQDLQVLSTTRLESNLYVNDNVELASSLSVKDSVYIDNDLAVKSNLQVTANTNIIGSLNVNNNTSLHSSLNVTDQVILDNTLSVKNKVYLNDDLEIIKNVLVHKDVNINESLNVVDITTLQSNLNVLKNTIISGQLSIGDNVKLDKSVEISENMIVHNDGIVNNSLTVFKDTFLNSNLNVNENTFLNKQLSVKESIYTDEDIDVNRNLNVGHNLDVKNEMRVDSSTILKATLNVVDKVELDNTLSVKNTAFFRDSVFIASNVSINEILSVGSGIISQSNVDVFGDTYLHNNVILDNQLSIGGGVNIENDLEISSNLIVHSNIYINDSLSVGNNLTCDTFVNNTLSTQDVYTGNIYVEGTILKAPVGLETERPLSNIAPIGSIFYNSNTKRFEGLHNLDNNQKKWLPFGGVIDIDSDTYITAEDTEDNDTLSFYVGGCKGIPVATLDSSYLSVNTDAVFDQDIYVRRNIDILKNINVHNNITVDSNINVLNDITIHSNVTIKNNLDVFNNGYFHSNVNIHSNLNVTNDLLVNNNGSISNDLNVSNNLIIGNNATIKNNLLIIGTLSVGNLITNTLTNITEATDVLCEGVLSVNLKSFMKDDVKMNRDCYIQDTLYSSNVEVMGNRLKIPVGSSLSRPDAVTSHTGSIFYNTSTMSFEGLHDFGGDKQWMPFGGVTDIDRDTYITAEKQPNDNTLSFYAGDRDTPLMTIKQNRLSTSTIVDINNDLNVFENIYLNNSLSIGQSLFVNNDVLLNNNLSINNTLYVSNDMIVDGNTVINGNTTINSDMTIRNNLISSNLSTNDIFSKDVNTSNLVSSNIYINGSILKIPVGYNIERPLESSTDYGSIYYNIDTMRFEGLHNLMGTKKWLPFGGVVDIDGDTYISAEKQPDNDTLSFHAGNKDISVMNLQHNSLSIATPTYINNTLTINNQLRTNEDVSMLKNVIINKSLSVGELIKSEEIRTSNMFASNIDVDGITISRELVFDGDYIVRGNLEVLGDLTINDTTFPLFPQVGDITKVLAVNDNNDYELMTLFHENKKCEFKSLFGIFETGVALENVSGLFDFGVPKYWLSGWSGRLFDGVDITDGVGVLAPNGSNVDMSTLELYEDLTTSNMDFKDFVNISMYKTNGEKLNKIAGIAVNDYVSPNYYFFLGTIDPNHDFFKYKFKKDFEHFYSNLPNLSYGSNYGYCVDIESIMVPHRNLHISGTTLFVVEFINTYDNCPIFSDSTYKFNRSTEASSRKNNYYITNNVTGTISNITDDTIGLYPHITYRKWNNASTPFFYEKLYQQELGWGIIPNVDDIFVKYHNNGMLKRLYKLSYNYIVSGKAEMDSISEEELDRKYLDNVVNVNGYNLVIHENINNNGNRIIGNYNSISFSKLAF